MKEGEIMDGTEVAVKLEAHEHGKRINTGRIE